MWNSFFVDIGARKCAVIMSSVHHTNFAIILQSDFPQNPRRVSDVSIGAKHVPFLATFHASKNFVAIISVLVFVVNPVHLFVVSVTKRMSLTNILRDPSVRRKHSYTLKTVDIFVKHGFLMKCLQVSSHLEQALCRSNQLCALNAIHQFVHVHVMKTPFAQSKSVDIAREKCNQDRFVKLSFAVGGWMRCPEGHVFCQDKASDDLLCPDCSSY